MEMFVALFAFVIFALVMVRIERQKIKRYNEKHVPAHH